eukprot:1136521-Pelagomonas_calceolata.AAC.2
MIWYAVDTWSPNGRILCSQSLPAGPPLLPGSKLGRSHKQGQLPCVGDDRSALHVWGLDVGPACWAITGSASSMTSTASFKAQLNDFYNLLQSQTLRQPHSCLCFCTA